jgi:hypothetical protein
MDSSERRRRLLTIGGTFIIIATIIGLYFVFFRTPPASDVTQPTFGETSGVREGVTEQRSGDRASGAGIFSPTARLRILSEEPVSGATTLYVEKTSTEEQEEAVRYGERETAHVYDVRITGLEKERVANTTIPRIYESLWTALGSGVLLRYVDDNNETIRTYFARLVEKEGELREGQTRFDLEGNFLPDNISHVALSPDKSRIFWLTETLQGSQGVLSSPDGTSAQTLFTLPFSEWLPQWHSGSALTLSTRASGHAEGFSYYMPLSTAELNRVLGDVSGLTTLTSPTGRYVLYSEGTTRSLSTYLHDTEEGAATELSIKTLPEKCTWANEETLYCGVPTTLTATIYPDAWYQGKVLFTDTIYEIDSSSTAASLLYSPESRDGEIIDMYKPFVSESGDYLIFNNKHDMSLWAFTINQGDSLNLPGPDEVLGL